MKKILVLWFRDKNGRFFSAEFNSPVEAVKEAQAQKEENGFTIYNHFWFYPID